MVLVLGIAAQWVAWRLHLPSILLLVSGIVVGPVISLSVAIILFEGGLSLSLRDLREIGAVAIRR